MALPGLVLIALVCSCSLLSFRVFAYSKPDRDGSTTISRRCECDSVRFWIPRRNNSASHLLSYEEIVSNPRNDVLLSRNELDNGLRFWMPKHCDLKFTDDLSILQRDSGINSRTNAKKVLEVWIRSNSFANCIAATFKCKRKTLCTGIRALNEAQSTRRKLLMAENDKSEETFAHKQYGVLLSVLVFCSIIILVALCGKAEKNSQESVAHDDDGKNVKIVSSEKVQTMKRTAEKSNKEEKLFEIKVEDPGNMATDNNSNNSKQLPGDIDLSLVPETGDKVDEDDGKTSVDGGIFGKIRREENAGDEQGKAMEGKENEGDRNHRPKSERGNNLSKKSDHNNEGRDHEKKEKRKEEKRKEKEDKQKEKDVKRKDRSKDMRSKRSNTSPERAESKTTVPKMRFSLKGSASSSNAYEEPKVLKRDKTKSKKKQELQAANTKAPPLSANRRSFVNRELPKRPSEERDNPPDIEDDSGDEHYEHVVVKGGPARKPTGPARKPTGPARNPMTPAVPSQNYDNDSDLYDSVDDNKVTKLGTTLGPDMDQNNYEVVDTKRSKLLAPSAIIMGKLGTPSNPDDYECVYENPGMGRQRSFSDILPGSSNPTPETKRKTMSLGRESSGGNAPTPPPLDHIQQVKQMHHVIDDIEPYTITRKSGDNILQETSGPYQFKPIRHVEPPVEGENLYTEVDKAKQKRDRWENASGTAQRDNAQQANESQLIIEDIEPYTITARKGDRILQEESGPDQVKPIFVKQDELKTPEEKEKLYTKVDREKQKKDRLEAEKEQKDQMLKPSESNGCDETTTSAIAASIEAEHTYETMPRNRAEKALKKVGSFEQTEDVELYEEVDTKTDKPKERPNVFE